MDPTLFIVMEKVEEAHDKDIFHHHGPFAFCLQSPCYEVLQACPEFVEGRNAPDWIPDKKPAASSV